MPPLDPPLAKNAPHPLILLCPPSLTWKGQCHTQSFSKHMGTCICTVYLSGTEDLYHGLGPCQKNVQNLEYLGWLKIHIPAWSKVFLQTL